MDALSRLRYGAVWLPIVEVEFAIRIFKDPKVRSTLIGDRRPIVDAALRILEEAKQDQVDGRIELDERHISVVLLAIGVNQAWLRDLLFSGFEDDEQF